MKTLKIKGKEYKVYDSDNPTKKFKIKHGDKEVHFGAKGYKISPGTEKGDRYCARSSGIKSKGDFSPNSLSRKKWRCIGKKSATPSEWKKWRDNLK